MQDYPVSWYIPWSIPIQKLIHLQQPLNVAPIATSSSMTAFVPAGVSRNALNCQILPTHRHRHLSNTIAPIQMQSTPSMASAVLHSKTTANIRLPIGNYVSTSDLRKESTVQSAATFIDDYHSHYHRPITLASSQIPEFNPQTLQYSITPRTMFSPMPHHTFLTCSSTVAEQTALKSSFSPIYKLNTTASMDQQITTVPSGISSHRKQPTAVKNVNKCPVTPNHQTNSSKAVYFTNGFASKRVLPSNDNHISLQIAEKRKSEDAENVKDLKKAKLETKALKAKRPGFTDDRYNETSYFIENGLRKVYPYYFTFTTFTKGRWVGEKILDIFSREFRAHSSDEYERCINAGTLTVNYEKVSVDYRLKHNDLLANIVHRHEVPVTCQPIKIVHMDEDIVVVNKPASIPVHPCGRYRHNTVVFILAKEFNLRNLRTIHRLDRLTSGLLLFGRTPKKARQLEQQIRNRQVLKEYVCRVEGDFPNSVIECKEPIEVVSYKIGVCKVSPTGKECTTTFQKIAFNGTSSVVLCKPLTGRMHQIRVHLQYLGYPVVNDPLYNHEVFGPFKGRGGNIGKTDEELVRDLIHIHNAENWLGIDDNTNMSLFNAPTEEGDSEEINLVYRPKCTISNNEESAALDSEDPKDESIITEILDFQGTSTSKSTIQYNNINTHEHKITTFTQTGHEAPDIDFNPKKMSNDKYCYECKVRYRDPKPKDLVMYLHAWKYEGPGWKYETDLPDWAKADWNEIESNKNVKLNI